MDSFIGGGSGLFVFWLIGVDRNCNSSTYHYIPSLTEGFLMVLPRRIELPTSPLPRGCSTTELRQHVSKKNTAPLLKQLYPTCQFDIPLTPLKKLAEIFIFM